MTQLIVSAVEAGETVLVAAVRKFDFAQLFQGRKDCLLTDNPCEEMPGWFGSI